MFEKFKDMLARAIFNYPPPARPVIPTLMDKLHECGFSDTSVDDWFYKKEVLEAIEELKKSSFPITNMRIDEIFGDLTLTFEDIINSEDW